MRGLLTGLVVGLVAGLLLGAAGRLSRRPVLSGPSTDRSSGGLSGRSRLQAELALEGRRRADLERRARELTRRARSVREAVEELSLLVRTAPEPPPVPTGSRGDSGVDTTVTAVHTVSGLVELGAGHARGVREGVEFVLYRGNEYVATLVVDAVARDSCVGHCVPELQKSPVRPGDLATNKL